MEVAAVPVRPIHHGRNLYFWAVHAITHSAILGGIS
jgi:hypothetical protein